MHILNLQISLLDMVQCLSNALDLISPALVNHHKRTAYIAQSIAETLALPDDEQVIIAMAGALHDIGACALDDRLTSFDYDISRDNTHAVIGSVFLNSFEPLSNLSPLIQYHHNEWARGEENQQAIPLGSHILHLADRIDILINNNRHILNQMKDITRVILDHKNTIFRPDAVDAFMDLADREYFWLDTVSSSVWEILYKKDIFNRIRQIRLDEINLIEFTRLFAKLIDFRSRFTATHSTGVAFTAEKLASIMGFSDSKCSGIQIAGFIHDFGKLAIPNNILEKPAELTGQESEIIKSHPYYTYRIFENLNSFSEINRWASYHHEYPNGKGYPFHKSGNELTTGSKIVSVCDVFTALMENRPYRRGMKLGKVSTIVNTMVKNGMLDKDVTSILLDNLDEIDDIRHLVQIAANDEYNRWVENLPNSLNYKIAN